MRTIASLIAVIVFCAPVASAQELPTAIVTANAPIYLRPGAQKPLRVAAAGTVLKVLKEEGEWVEVEFNDPQFGRRVGWVEARLVRISRPELRPMDLSVPHVRPDAPATADRTVEQPRPVEAARASPAASRLLRGWLNVNLGAAASAQRAVTAEANRPDAGGELTTIRVGYRAPTGASFDFGGGVMITPVIGIGIQFTGTAHTDEADLFIRIPHPLFFNAFASDSSESDGRLDRVEGGVNLSLVGALPVGNRNVSVRLYGGPTYFRLQADAITNIRYRQQFGLFTAANTVEILSSEREKVEETAWGFHFGADVGYFFSRHVGIGGFARVTRGRVTFDADDFILDRDLDVKVGGFQAGGGLRLRF